MSPARAARWRARKDSVPLAASVASSGQPEDGGARPATKRLARPEGLEPSTPGLEGRCSIQLSYGRPDRYLTGPQGVILAYDATT